ncbi:hypothetical protein RhiirA4_480521 [Rhizophagus irregularis]|uniref:RNase H type-1 domain-containing protein n=1 Tax=Rhizophagus irregularis TaxID=588596 RepID=A0A2I1HI46_9GLOM|nr:hypothetical protein RhiirA4_480521 [Rhizophagus irregularis]
MFFYHPRIPLRLLGVWFSLSASSQFVLKQARSMVKDMAALLGPKKLLAQHVAYLYNVVLLLRLEFRLQTTLFSESTVQSIVKLMFSVLKRKAGLASTTPLALLILKLPFSIQNAFYRFLSSHIASWQKIFTHPDFKDFANYAISFLQGYLGAEDYSFYPQWAINFNNATQTLSVGHVCITYRKKDSAIMSHWLPVSSSADERSYNPCPGCSYSVPAFSKKSAIKLRCNSEKCFFQVCLSETVGYPTRNAKVFAAYLPITLSTTWSYATSLALHYLDDFLPNLSIGLPLSDNTGCDVGPSILPSSTCSLYTDGSFHRTMDNSPPSMACAWLALDDDDFILESSSSSLPSCFPSALRSEIYAVLLGLKALSPGSSVTITTDCAQLISLWTQFVDAPFSPKLLRQPNHLLWLSIRHLLDNLDVLAQAAHLSSQPTFSPLALYQAPCLLNFNSLPIDMNIRHFLCSIGDARNFLSFCSLARFTALGSPALFDWAGIHYSLFQIKGFASHNNGHPEFWIFRIKLLLDMLPTLTTLQQRKPYLYSLDWLCPQCNTAPEDINHLWICPYILPELNPCLTHRKEVIKFRDDCITAFTSLKTLPDSFCGKFSVLDCWNYITPSTSCLWLTRGLLPAHLTDFLKEYFSLSVIYKVISPLLNDFQLELYGEICRATCSGSNDLKRITIYFQKKEDLDNATVSPLDSLFGLHFHAYDPQAIKADEHARTLVVTDIPIFTSEALLHSTFSRYSNIVRCHTRLAKLYCTAYITYESTVALQNLDSTWGVLCGGHCLRVFPASFSSDQRAERRTHVALLASLLRGTIAVDFAEIADEVSAKSINVPFSMNSYSPKPYAYCHFSSETAMENAKSISCASRMWVLLGILLLKSLPFAIDAVALIAIPTDVVLPFVLTVPLALGRTPKNTYITQIQTQNFNITLYV